MPGHKSAGRPREALSRFGKTVGKGEYGGALIRLMGREMKGKSQHTRQTDRPRWQSLGQLAQLWGLSRARTREVLRGLVRSGRMEVRTLEREEAKEREYRVVPTSRLS